MPQGQPPNPRPRIKATIFISQVPGVLVILGKFCKKKYVSHFETGLESGTFCSSASMLAPGHTSPRSTKYRETVGTKYNYLHLQLG